MKIQLEIINTISKQSHPKGYGAFCGKPIQYGCAKGQAKEVLGEKFRNMRTIKRIKNLKIRIMGIKHTDSRLYKGADFKGIELIKERYENFKADDITAKGVLRTKLEWHEITKAQFNRLEQQYKEQKEREEKINGRSNFELFFSL